nr:glycosyltransferase family 2 protein [Thioalkalivibrio sp.]
MADQPRSSNGGARVAVVMLTLNQRDTTLRALRSLMPQVGERDRVLVWDNGSADGTVQAVREAFPEVLAHHHPENLGVASGRNAGAKMAMYTFDPEYLLFLDNDLVLQPGYLAAMIQTLDTKPTVGQVQSKLLYLNEPNRINDGGGCQINFWLGRTKPVGFRQLDRGQWDQPAPCISCGGSMMVRAGLFSELGGFDGLFNPFGPEDLDFSLRLQEHGFQALYDPRAVALHEVGHTYDRATRCAKTYARSRTEVWLRFLRRHGTPAQRAGFFVIGTPLFAARLAYRELSRGDFGAAVDSLRGMFEAFRTTS